jgi:hypothetical protein
MGDVYAALKEDKIDTAIQELVDENKMQLVDQFNKPIMHLDEESSRSPSPQPRNLTEGIKKSSGTSGISYVSGISTPARLELVDHSLNQNDE